MNSEALKESIKQYEYQLECVTKSLETEKKSDRNDLIDLRTDLEQLIRVSKDYLLELTDQQNESQTNEIDDEYLNFMNEIAALDDSSQQINGVSTHEETENLKDNLQGIIGMKCIVTHTHKSGCVEKHLAMVSEICNSADIQNMEDIQVKIMFTHPTLLEMLPCPYFLNGECKYDSEECQYSHGKIVPLINLRDYDKPDYSAILNGDSVLVKEPNQLWSKATITDIENDVITISKDGKIHCIVNFEDIVPIEQLTTMENEGDDSFSSDESDDSDEKYKEIPIQSNTKINVNESDLAHWEKYTKGIGSKLMLAMGYQMGMGLGKECDGRIEPVPVQILPNRMSLDHCMKMREDAGGDENFFSINRRIRKIKKSIIKSSTNRGTISKKHSDVFGLINDMLLNRKEKSDQKQTLKASTSKELNLSSFQIGENIRKTEKDILKYQESLKRQKNNSAAHKEIYQKLEAKQQELSRLKNSENAVFAEQRIRKEKTKLNVF